MAKLRINGDSSGYVDLEAPNAASSSTLDLDQVPQKNAANVFTTAQTIQNDNAYFAGNLTESSNAAIALRVTPTRAGQTKGISLGSIGKNGSSSTGIQAYDTSDNSSNTLELNPHGGAVTTPSQPGFRAGRNSNYTPGSSATIVFNTTASTAHFNTGNHYSTSTGLFTAPVTGKYVFHTCVLWGPGTVDGTAMHDSFRFRLNSTVITYSHRRAEYVNGTTGNDGYYADFATDIIPMSANDTMGIWSQKANQVHGNQQYTLFSGYLLG